MGNVLRFQVVRSFGGKHELKLETRYNSLWVGIEKLGTCGRGSDHEVIG